MFCSNYIRQPVKNNCLRNGQIKANKARNTQLEQFKAWNLACLGGQDAVTVFDICSIFGNDRRAKSLLPPVVCHFPHFYGILYDIPLLITISDNEQAHIKPFALQSHQQRTTVRGEWPQGPSPQLQQSFSLTLILPVILPLCSNHTDIRLPHCELNGALPDFLLSPPINGSSVLFSPCPNGSFTHNQSALLLLKGFPKGSTICIHLQSKLLLFTLFCYQECSLKQINWHKYNLPLKRQ